MRDYEDELEDLQAEQRAFVREAGDLVESLCKNLDTRECADLLAVIEEATGDVYFPQVDRLQDAIHTMKTGGY